MIKKIIIFLSLLIAFVSYYIVVYKHGISIQSWALVSVSPFLILLAVSLFARLKMLQAVLVPFLVFYGLGSVLNIPWIPKFYFAHFTGLVMLASAVYIIFTQLLRLRLVRIVVGITAGIIIFFLFKYYQQSHVREIDLKRIPKLEKRLLF